MKTIQAKSTACEYCWSSSVGYDPSCGLLRVLRERLLGEFLEARIATQ